MIALIAIHENLSWHLWKISWQFVKTILYFVTCKVTKRLEFYCISTESSHIYLYNIYMLSWILTAICTDNPEGLFTPSNNCRHKTTGLNMCPGPEYTVFWCGRFTFLFNVLDNICVDRLGMSVVLFVVLSKFVIPVNRRIFFAILFFYRYRQWFSRLSHNRLHYIRKCFTCCRPLTCSPISCHFLHTM